MKATIYKIVSPSGKFYIGSTKTALDKRLSVHLHYLKNNTHTNKRLQGAMNKYQILNIEVLEEFEYIDNKEIRNKEQYYIDLLKPEYNICQKAYRAEMSKLTREKISNTLKDIKFSEERKNNISKGRTGIKPIISLETKERLNKFKKEKYSKAVIGKHIITKDIVNFNSIKEAEQTLKITNLSVHISRKQKRCGEYVFKFKDSEEDLDLLILNINQPKKVKQIIF